MNDTINDLLAEYAKAPQKLRYLIAELTPIELSFKPSEREWSVKEIVIHLADSETNAFLRYRTIISEPNRETFVVDEWKWSQELKYQEQEIEEYLNLFESLRLITSNQLKIVTEQDWNKSVVHRSLGEISLTGWLELYVRHFEQHIKQIERTLENHANKR